MEIFAAFSEDIRQGFLICRPLPAECATATVHLFSALHKVRIRALDAIHLVIATDLPANLLVSSDRIMVEGARTLGLAVVEF
jgi:hypothetical protein